MIELYYIHGSPPSRTILMVARELGIKLELKEINLLAGEQHNEEFLKVNNTLIRCLNLTLISDHQLNPYHTVPVLVDDDLVLTENRAAVAYLIDKFAPDHELYPKDPKVRARIENFLYFDAGEIWPVVKSSVVPILYHATLPAEATLEKFQEQIRILNKFLEGKKYLVGNNRTVADLSIYASLSLSNVYADDKFEGFEHVQNWFKNIQTEIKDHEEINLKPIKGVVDYSVELMASKGNN